MNPDEEDIIRRKGEGDGKDDKGRQCQVNQRAHGKPVGEKAADGIADGGSDAHRRGQNAHLHIIEL